MKRDNLATRASHLIEYAAGILLGAITILVVASAIGRYLLSTPIPDAFDLSRLLIGAAIMWGFASVGFRGSHIKVDLLAEMLPAKARRIVDAIAWAVLLAFTCVLAWKLKDRTLGAMASGEATFDLRIPSWYFYALILAGVTVSILTTAVRLVKVLRGEGLEHFETIEPKDGDDGEPSR